MAGVEERACDDADRIREVDDPGVGGGELAHAVGDAEHDGDSPKGLAEPAGAGRLLPDATARERDGLVGQAGSLPTDADLDQDEVGAVERAVEVVGDAELAVVALTVEH